MSSGLSSSYTIGKAEKFMRATLKAVVTAWPVRYLELNVFSKRNEFIFFGIGLFAAAIASATMSQTTKTRR